MPGLGPYEIQVDSGMSLRDAGGAGSKDRGAYQVTQDYTRTPEFGQFWEAWLASDDSLPYRQGFNRHENRAKGIAAAMSMMLAARDRKIDFLVRKWRKTLASCVDDSVARDMIESDLKSFDQYGEDPIDSL